MSAAWSLPPGREVLVMIQVRVPIDLGTITMTQCSAFALATPMRVRDVLALAVAAALGRRSADDRRERNLRTMLDGLRDGHFVLDIDGRTYSDPDAYLLCSGDVMIRFFAQHAKQSQHRRRKG